MTANLNLWLIPILPLAGAAINGFLGKKSSRSAVSTVGLVFSGAAFAWAVSVALRFSSFDLPYQEYIAHWIRSGSFSADFALYLDQLSLVMLLVVTGGGFLIHIYSVGYMWDDPSYYRFFAYLNLFMFFMLTLILANNYLLMFIGWEGVGLASYLLIGFWFTKDSAASAGKKAFIVNRIGDFGFLIGLFLLIQHFGSLTFEQVFHSIAPISPETAGAGGSTAVGLRLMVGACGKSAQIPLYVWLPDAMEGPTPVSALIHAATMVTAGVYMVARSNALFVLAPGSMKTMAFIGAFTALFAASIALVQNDIKRVLAYSTVSQLGYMFLALGVGAFAAGAFHVFTHAFFKALLFLGAGSVIHAMSGEQDMRNMGDLHRRIPITHWTMFIATFAIAGIPPFAGFFSKDEILWQAWSSEGGAYRLLWLVGYATALMTAFYMFRLMFLTFHGQPRMSHEVEHHIHESPKSMTVPLIVLALCAVSAGWLGWPHSLGGSNRFENFLEPVFAREAEVFQAEGRAAQLASGQKEEEHPNPIEYFLMAFSVAAAVVGFGMAWTAYRDAGKGYEEPIAEATPQLSTVLFNKYFGDEAYDVAVTGRRKVRDVRLGVLGLGEASSWFDSHVIDGIVNGGGSTTSLFGTISSCRDKRC